MIRTRLHRIVPVLAVLVLLGGIVGAARAADAPKDHTVTGQHRGYTNEKLFLRLDDDKEMTFVVRIPGDKDEHWHDQFATLSRITVTYHEEAGAKFPVATAIQQAPAPKS
jgi:hypothetical protein